MAYNFTIIYRKGSKNTRVDALSKRQDYSGKPTERPQAILKEGDKGIEYNHELLATILVVKDNELEKRLKNAYAGDVVATSILKQQTEQFTLDKQGLVRFKGLVYVLALIRKELVREQHSLLAHRHQGIARTFERLARNYYFPRIRKYVETEVLECDLCNKSKASRHVLYRLL